MNQVVLEGFIQDVKAGEGRNGSMWAMSSLKVQARVKSELKSMFVTIKGFGEQAQAMMQTQKGDRVTLFGRIEVSEYEKDGVRKKDTSVVAARFFSQPGVSDEQPFTAQEVPF